MFRHLVIQYTQEFLSLTPITEYQLQCPVWTTTQKYCSVSGILREGWPSSVFVILRTYLSYALVPYQPLRILRYLLAQQPLLVS